jgi:hypothetical protein
MPRQELTKIRLKFLVLRAVESWRKFSIVIILVITMKISTVSAVIFMMP